MLIKPFACLFFYGSEAFKDLHVECGVEIKRSAKFSGKEKYKLANMKFD